MGPDALISRINVRKKEMFGTKTLGWGIDEVGVAATGRPKGRRVPGNHRRCTHDRHVSRSRDRSKRVTVREVFVDLSTMRGQPWGW